MKSVWPLHEIDLAAWKRARHYALYSEREFPFAGVTTQLDISEWDADRIKKGRKFFPAFMHAAMAAMNSIENFRYRIENGKVLLCDQVDPAYVVFSPEDELYYFAIAEFTEDPVAFDRNMEQASRIALETRCLECDRGDVIYASCTPWYSFTDIIQPMCLNTADSIPRLVWGKYTRENGKTIIPLSITGHHGLFDGLHIARLFEKIQKSTAAAQFPDADK